MNHTFTTTATTANAISNGNYFPLIWCIIIGFASFLHVRFEAALKETKDMVHCIKLQQTALECEMETYAKLTTAQMERINRLESEIALTDNLIGEVTTTMEHVKEQVDQGNTALNDIHGGHFIGTLTYEIDKIIGKLLINIEYNNDCKWFCETVKTHVDSLNILENVQHKLFISNIKNGQNDDIIRVVVNVANKYLLLTCYNCACKHTNGRYVQNFDTFPNWVSEHCSRSLNQWPIIRFEDNVVLTNKFRVAKLLIE